MKRLYRLVLAVTIELLVMLATPAKPRLIDRNVTQYQDITPA
jgi:hypothetical protein